MLSLISSTGVKPEQLHADGWAIGYDARFPENVRIQQALLFARWGRHENLYAHPMVSDTSSSQPFMNGLSLCAFRISSLLSILFLRKSSTSISHLAISQRRPNRCSMAPDSRLPSRRQLLPLLRLRMIPSPLQTGIGSLRPRNRMTSSPISFLKTRTSSSETISSRCTFYSQRA